MTRRADFERALRWYPAAWRRRYGAELAALLEDTYGPGPVPWRGRISLLRAGSVERLRTAGLLGSATSPSEGIRAGSLLVLWAWAVFMVAGAGFASLADNWQAAMPPGAWLPAAGYDVAQVSGLAGGVIVLLAAGGCAPWLVRFLRAGGWRPIRGRLLLAAALMLVTIAAVTAMVLWAHRLGTPERNGGLWTYSALFVLVAVLVTATIAAWTAASAAVVRRLELPAGILRYCRALAVALTMVMVVLAGAVAAWWTAIASGAPWFLGGTAPGSSGTVAPVALIAVGVLMILGLILGITGARRATTSLRRMT
jgi:hypothetical protein